jgi:hypothetical protein
MSDGGSGPAAPRLLARPAWVLLVLVAILAGQALIELSYGFTVQDDAFISYRYADHFAAGHGLVFNRGERVEGYTNFLWTLALGIAAAAGLSPLSVSVVLGVTAAAGLVLAVFLIAGRTGLGHGPALVAAGVVGLSPALALEAVQGLETTWFAFALAMLFVRWLQELEDPGARAWSGLWAGLAALTRPEAVMVFGLLELVALSSGSPWRSRARAWATFLALLVPHELWRIAYYGAPLPNTFYAKVGHTTDQVWRGIGYVLRFAREHPLVSALALLGALPALRGSHGRAAGRAAVVVSAAYTLYVVAVGGDFKASWRFVLPYLGLLAWLVACGALWLARRRGSLLPLLALLLGAEQWRAYGPQAQAAAWRANRLQEQLLTAGLLRERFPPDTLIATHQVGAVPWRTGFPTIDMLGLNDAHIARVEVPGMGSGIPGHEKTDYAYVFSRAPGVYIPTNDFVTAAPQPGPLPNGFPPEFHRDYEPRSFAAGGRWINLYVRRSDAAAVGRRP